MHVLGWTDAAIKRMTWVQIAVIKICVMAFTLLVAKFYPIVLSLEWYWYAAVFGVTYLYLLGFVWGRPGSRDR